MQNKCLVFIVLTLLLFSGCAQFQRAEIARRAQTEMIGMSKKELFTCAGVPIRQERVDDLEFLVYSSGGDSFGPMAAMAIPSSSTAIGIAGSMRFSCELTFILKDEIIQKINYSGRTGEPLTKGEQCAFVIENCLKNK
jgi:hypothetical protein